MKFLVVGLGSMGKRRIRNLKKLGINEIIAFDLRKDRCEEVKTKYNVDTFLEFNESIKESPNVMIISTPPDLHMKYANLAIENNMHFFTEASVVKDEMEEVIEKLKNSKLIGLPSCTMRYHPIIKKINELLKNDQLGKVLAFFYHSGQYLPDWHPWEDYRKFYVSKKNTGACREIVPFELIWITSTFGNLKNVIGNKGKISNLDSDIDDIYNIIIELQNGIKGTMTVDVIARAPIRNIKILLEEGVIEADWYKKSIRVFSKNDNWTEYNVEDGIAEKNYLHGEEPYIEEMKNFLLTIEGKIDYPYTFEEDLQILNILEKIEKSSDTGSKQKI